MIGGFGREKLVKMVRLKVWTGLYIVIVKVGRMYKLALGKFGWPPSVILAWTEVVLTIASFLFLFAQ